MIQQTKTEMTTWNNDHENGYQKEMEKKWK
jgi:hypothetical protein